MVIEESFESHSPFAPLPFAFCRCRPTACLPAVCLRACFVQATNVHEKFSIMTIFIYYDKARKGNIYLAKSFIYMHFLTCIINNEQRR